MLRKKVIYLFLTVLIILEIVGCGKADDGKNTGNDKIIKEYAGFKNQIGNDAMAEGSQSNITKKKHNDSYYEITDAYPKDRIYIISRYQNWAEGYVCKGCFIDEHGYMYEFDLSDHDFEEERKNYELDSFEDAFMDALYYEVYYKNAPVRQLETSYLEKIWDLMWCINYDAEWIEKSVACDAGQYSLYTCIDFEMNRISTTGDWDGYLDDEAAINLSQLIGVIREYYTEIE